MMDFVLGLSIGAMFTSALMNLICTIRHRNDQ